MHMDELRQKAYRMLEDSIGGTLAPGADVWWGYVCEHDRFHLTTHEDGTSEHEHEHAKGARGERVGVWARYGDVSVYYMKPTGWACKDCGDATENVCTCCGQPTCINCITDPNHGECDQCFEQAWDAQVDAQVHRTTVQAAVNELLVRVWELERALHTARMDAKACRLALALADAQIRGLCICLRATDDLMLLGGHA